MCIVLVVEAKAQADNMCPRGVYVYVHGRIDVGGESERLVDDPSFTMQMFFNYFGKFFQSPRLSLKPTVHPPEYSLSATFCKLKGRGTQDISLLAIVFSFVGGRVPENGYDGLGSIMGYVPYYYSGTPLLDLVSKADGYDLAAHVPIIQKRMSNLISLDDLIVKYEQIPIKVNTNNSLSCHDAPEYLTFDGFEAEKPPIVGFPYHHSLRVVLKSQNGVIENGEFMKEDFLGKVFDYFPPYRLPEWKLHARYGSPQGDDKSDVVTLYNSCEICFPDVVPMNETKAHSILAQIKIDCRRRWDVNYTYTEQMNVSSPQLMANRQYSLNIQGPVYFKEHKGTNDIYESKSAVINLSDSFNQHITTPNSPPDSDTHWHGTWTASKNGQVPMTMRLVFNTHSHRYTLSLPPWKGDPVEVKGTYQWVGVPRTADGAREFACRAIEEELPGHGITSPEVLARGVGGQPPEAEPYQEGQTVLKGEYSNLREQFWGVGCVCCSGDLNFSLPLMLPAAGIGALAALNACSAVQSLSKPWTKSVKWEIRKVK
jgi:hypothetical protein